jgi:RNA polymerase-binding transcription factor DksA
VADIDKEKVAARLRERAQEIEERRKHVAADDDEQRDAELADYDQHPADQGSETYGQELDQTTLAILDAQAKDVVEAQKRLEDGTYGKCIVDGADIPAERLEAIPEAIRCIRHQSVYDAELRGRGGGLL